MLQELVFEIQQITDPAGFVKVNPMHPQQKLFYVAGI
jgi:hypothetical protein